jgi:2-keto-4-pentenoate hydratase/2-oxohepta-3-ene-1,7-dioic acid hydratase in catechol pathway
MTESLSAGGQRRLQPPRWGLVSYLANGDQPQAGVQTADGAIRSLLPVFGCVSLLSLVQRWPEVAPQLEGLDEQALPAVAQARLDLPLRMPSKLAFAGANYYDHAAEMGTPVPDGTRPFFFTKPPSTTLIGDGGEIPIDDSQQKIDWEAELGVVIGRRSRKLDVATALDCVAGYVVINDITDRARLARLAPVLGPPFAFDWLSAKALDCSCPMSAAIVPAFVVGDAQSLRVCLWVNGEIKQDGNTENMVANVPRLLAELSDVMTLEPGDVVATGTPAGVGVARGEFLRPGDVVTAAVERVGQVTNTVTRRGAHS